MTTNEKPDSEEFRLHLQTVRKRYRDTAQYFWPFYLFHFSDIRNVVQILEGAKISSRQEISAKKIKSIDIAEPEIIARTDQRWKTYVRFYFRPLTPTLYRNEGIRPKHHVWQNAHCPVPVYLLFAIEPILCRMDSYFSHGTLASGNSEIFNSADDFRRIPFEYVYHTGSMPESLKSTIKYHRHAEVIVKGAVDLQHLQWVWCRSEAELITLRSMLSAETRDLWSKKLRSTAEHSLFNRNWVYIDHVYLDHKQVQIQFNKPAKLDAIGPFHLLILIEEYTTGITYKVEDDQYKIDRSSVSFSLRNLKDPTHYKITATLDNHLAYQNIYLAESQLTDIPF